MDRDKMNKGNARFWFGDGGTSEKISYMNSTKAYTAMACQNFGSEGHSAKMYSSNTLEKF